MIDLYLVFVPILALLVILTCVALKLSLIELNVLSKRQAVPFTASNEPYRTTLLYLLRTITLLQLNTRRAKNQLSLLLSLSGLGLLCYIYPSPFAFCFVGAVTGFIQVGLEVGGYAMGVRVAYGIVGISAGLGLMGCLYKNYFNSILGVVGSDLLINFTIDNLILKPLICVLIALPLSRVDKMQHFIAEEADVTEFLEGKKEVPKEIYPQKILEKVMPVGMERSQDTYSRAMEILRKIKKERMLPPINLQRVCGESSLNSIFNSGCKEPISPIEEKMPSLFKEEDSKNLVEGLKVLKVGGSRVGGAKVEGLRGNRKVGVSQNLILIDGSLNNEMENEEEIKGEKECSKKQKEESLVPNNPPLQVQENPLPPGQEESTVKCDREDNRSKVLRIHYEEGDAKLPMRIFMNHEANFEESDEEGMDGKQTRREDVCRVGVLEVHEKMEEVDLNSPVREKRKKSKKMSLDAGKKRVIRFTTGEPYLEYLPNMLNDKKDQAKKTQRNSVKRAKKMSINDQNVPDFTIQDL